MTWEIIEADTSLDLHETVTDHKDVFPSSAEYKLNSQTQFYGLFCMIYYSKS